MITLEPPRTLLVDEDPWSAWGLSRVGLSRFAKRAQAAVKLSGEVDVLLAGDRKLRQLNRQFRGKDKATDVLSFPAPAEFEQGHAGDLALSLETAARQAREHGHELQDELKVLLLHGLLHLAGFDHETDRGEMAAREAELRVALRLNTGLIARVQESMGARADGAKSKRKVRAVKRAVTRAAASEVLA